MNLIQDGFYVKKKLRETAQLNTPSVHEPKRMNKRSERIPKPRTINETLLTKGYKQQRS